MRNDGNSQCDEIIRALKSGARLTPIDALGKFGCFRLSGRIYELRQQGHQIESRLVDFRGKRVAEYRLKRKARAA